MSHPYPDDWLEPLAIDRLVLLPGPWKRRFDLNRTYLMALENEAFLEAFHWCHTPPNCPVPRPTVPWGGWMGTTHDGEFHGHYLSACARAIALSRDLELAAKTAALVDRLARYQQPNGALWVGCVTADYLDALHRGKAASIPYYTIHKLLMGLYELGILAENKQALEMSVRLADFVATLLHELHGEQIKRALICEHGGIAEIMLDVAAHTQRQQHFDAAIALLDRSVIDPLARGEDILTQRHANTTIPILQGAARAFELTGEVRYRQAVETFWHLVQATRQSATGADGSCHENWTAPNALKASLNASTQETCGTYNWLRLTEYLFRWTGDARYGDAYERAQINGILAAQHPETGMFVYFMPMKPGPRIPNPDNFDPDPPEGGSKHFGRPLQCFWCCYGTGVQAFANPLTAVYYRQGDAIWINQYVASTLTTTVNGIPLRLEIRTAFPDDDTVTLIVRLQKAATFTLNLRIPAWTGADAEVRVNFGSSKDTFANAISPGPSWLRMDRAWGDSDAVTLRLPMRVTSEPIRDDPRCIAMLFGPHVLAGCVREATVLPVDPAHPAQWLSPCATDRFAFLYDGPPAVKFVPLSRIVGEEYNIYFDTL